MAVNPVFDTDWFREANLLPSGAISNDDLYYREYTSAQFKFTDTSLGGNFAINTPPQFCANADPVTKSYVDVLSKVESNLPYKTGMGRWYSEVIDDNAVLMHMRFGVPVYNSLTEFFGNFYNSDAASIARTGESAGFFNLIGKAIGWAFSIRMLPLILTGTAWKFFTGTTNTRFMYLRPMMGTYWKYVSDIANTIASSMEITAQASDGYMEFADRLKQQVDGGVTFSDITKPTDGDPSTARAAVASTLRNFDDEISNYNNMLPDIYKSGDPNSLLSGIDMYSVATRAQRLANAWHQGIKDNAENAKNDANGAVHAIRNWMQGGGAKRDLTAALNNTSYKTAEDYLDNYFKTAGKSGVKPGSTPTTGNTDPNMNPDAAKQQAKQNATPSSGPVNATTAAPAARAVPQYGQTQAQADAAAAQRAKMKAQRDNSNQSYADAYAQAASGSSPAVADQTKRVDADGAPAAAAQPAAGAQAAAAGSTEEAMRQSFLGAAYETVKDFFSGDAKDPNSMGAIVQGYMHDGSGWITFRINGRPSVSETFSNSSRDSSVGQAFNSVSTSARDLRNSLADGNLIDIPILSDIVGKVAGAVGSVISGASEALKINGFAALAGNAFVDIQKHWDESSMSFQQISVDMELRAPYGNPLSRFQNEVVPMVCAIAATCPQATGASSHSAPFYCEWYCRGRGSSRLSIVKSLSIERGVANAPWAPNGAYRGVNIRMDMEDLSTIAAMPLNPLMTTTTIFNPTNWPRLLFPQDSTFSDYTSVLASCGLSESVYKVAKFKRNFKKIANSLSKVYSPSSIVNSIFDGYRSTILTALAKPDRS